MVHELQGPPAPPPKPGSGNFLIWGSWWLGFGGSGSRLFPVFGGGAAKTRNEKATNPDRTNFGSLLNLVHQVEPKPTCVGGGKKIAGRTKAIIFSLFTGSTMETM